MRKLKTFAPSSIIILLINILIISSCVSETRKAAEQKMNQASGLILSGEFERGMALLDSIPVWFPEEYGIVGKALNLKKEAASAYHHEFIEQAQTMLDEFTPQITELSKNFIFTEGPPGRPGTYEHKRQTVRRSWNRIFLKTNVTENGQFWLSTHYFGSDWIDHYCIKVYDKELYLFSDTIPLSHLDNRKIEDGTDRWEKIDFRDGADNGIVGLIAQYQDRRLKVRFTGKKHYYIVMESFDKKAVKEGYELAQVLKEVYELKQKIGQHKKELRLLGVSDE
ncbi:MAG: hypothetical protein U9N86_00650 [Bacteroidota bacterium]|nr:hypothetical protein [Bacteroidota bacterium]